MEMMDRNFVVLKAAKMEDFAVNDIVVCTIFHPMAMADGTFKPDFLSWTGQILSIRDGKYEIWGPNGEQSTVVGKECLKRTRK